MSEKIFEGDLPPDNEDFIRYLLKMFNEKKADGEMKLSAFVRIMQMIMRDELNGAVTIKEPGLINVVFENGEQFNVKIEKG